VEDLVDLVEEEAIAAIAEEDLAASAAVAEALMEVELVGVGKLLSLFYLQKKILFIIIDFHSENK
jgi:hypothetical protein